MATRGGAPKWLTDCKDHIYNTGEWKSFMGELQQAIQQQLKESHVASFIDLTDPERSLFLERASKAIHPGQIYRDFYAEVSHSLDQHVSNEVARKMLEEYPLETKSDLILEQTQEGAISLLHRWPQLKWKLRACFNRPLPGPVRQLAWRLYLENTKLRKVYLNKSSGNARSAISQTDHEISQKCDYLLKAEPTFEELRGSFGAFSGMKTVLSFHHTRKKNHLPLSDIEYILLVPFVTVVANKMSRREPAPGKLVAVLVEEYITFIEARPGYLVDSGSEGNNKEMTSFAQSVVTLAKEQCPEVVQAVSTAYAPDNDQLVSTDVGNQNTLTEGMMTLIRPIIRALFVGYLSLEVVLFIWDQYIIGSDVIGFVDKFLAVAMTTHLHLLQEKLKECSSPAAMETTLKLESSTLTIYQFQQQFKLHHYDNLTKVLTKEDQAGLPVLDPTQAQYVPWTHWHKENIPTRIGVHERRQAREEREAERKHQLHQYRETQEQRALKEEEERKAYYLRFIDEQEANRLSFDCDRQRLEDLLQMERKQRVEAERGALLEIEKLKQEVEDLKHAKQMFDLPSGSSAVGQFVLPQLPMARSTEEEAPLPDKLRSPLPGKPANTQTEEVILDFFQRVAIGFCKLGHGSDSEQTELDQGTKTNINIHKEDIKQAQLEVFGRQLKEGEFERQHDSEREKASDRMMETITQRMHKRRHHELAS